MTTIITLENELEAWLKEYARASGLSLEDAARDILSFWKELHRKEDELLSGWTTEELRAEIKKGLESESSPWNADEFLDETHG